MQPNLGQRIAAARRQQFVGRQAECRLLRSALLSFELPFCILYLHGPGGVGKTSLLQSFAGLCDTLHIPHSRLDARHIEASPSAFTHALRDALALAPTDDPIAFLEAASERRVLILDTFELLDGMQAWLRDVFLPRLSTQVLLIAAGRHPPAAAWSFDAGWNAVFRAVRLQNFSPDESRTYLHQRAVPSGKHAAAIAFTHGHPLALSLLADLYGAALPSDIPLTGEMALPLVVDTLLKRLMAEMPGGLRKSALEVCAVVRGVNEDLLREMLFPPPEDAADVPPRSDEAAALFSWLQTLSFVDSGPSGLFPHDIAREALLADLRWRVPDWYVELHRRARRYYIQQLQKASGEDAQKRLLYDGVFLHRDSETVRSVFTWNEAPAVLAHPLQKSDLAPLQNLVAVHEGEAAAQVAGHWLKTQPGAAVVFRTRPSDAGSDEGEEPVAFFLMLNLHQMTPADCDADPAARVIADHIAQAGPLRENEGATCLRFWMTRDTYQAASPLQSLLIVHALRHFLTRGQRLAYTFFCCPSPQNWQAIFDYAKIPLVAEYRLDGQIYGVFGRDWRRESLAKWLEYLAEKETDSAAATGARGGVVEPPASPVAPTAAETYAETYVPLTRTQFAAAVQDALRHLHRPDKLRLSPLLQSRLVEPGQTGDALKKLLLETAERLNEPNVKTQRAYLALRHTYLAPAKTQEAAADRLDLPLSTYRRHLAEGVAAVSALLWYKEIDQNEN